MTNAPKLLPCPFCGSDHIAQECGIGGEPYMSCVDCGANVEGKAGTWNTRALDPRVAALVEAVDYILDGMGIDFPDYTIDPKDDFLDAATSEWVCDTLHRLAAALAAFKGGADDRQTP